MEIVMCDLCKQIVPKFSAVNVNIDGYSDETRFQALQACPECVKPAVAVLRAVRLRHEGQEKDPRP
jgi:hypothetical protein